MRIQLVSVLILSLTAATAAPAQSTSDSSRTDTTRAPVTTGYGAWFGSIPDMNANSVGILLAGVTEDSPADKAGLKQGDLIIRMAGDGVVDLMDMVTVLRAHPPGETIEVVYLRGETEHKVKVTLGLRPGGR